jgi:KaiC/GvpD/RAD55 family RecA-like ATPase
MTDGVVSLRPDLELAEFLDFMWGEQQGYAYVPIKEPKTEDAKWETKFFEWPKEREEIISYILKTSPVAEVYFGPALYKNPGSPVPENILGTNVLWTEFDGNAPKGGVLGDRIPHPTMRVRSSNEGHEHFYWRLDYFETDRAKIENINRAIAYTLQADSSAWDSTQILRPVSTKNHKRDRIVRLVTSSASKFSKEFFNHLEYPKQLAKEAIILEEVPEALDVIFKYPWSTEDAEFFRKREMATGTRSSALMRLAFICAENRMSDEEAFAILLNADNRWGKFKDRKDQQKRLLDLLNRARHKYPVDPEAQIDGLPVFSWGELLQLEVHVDWLIPGILQRQGIMVVSGKPGVGKTQLTIQALLHIALGKPFLGWDITAPRKVAFISMEMGQAEIKVFMEEMDSILSIEDRELLHANFLIIPIGQTLMFDSTADQKKIETFLDVYKPEVAGFDSLSKTTLGSLEEATVKKVMDFADRIRMNYDCSVVFIHHDRKAQIGNKRPKNLEDIYGSFYITATATTVLGMWQSDKTYEIELNYLKVRLAKAPNTQHITRTERGLSFEVSKARTLVEKASDDTRPEGEKPKSINDGDPNLGF